MEMNIHGFSQSEVAELYRYLCIYECELRIIGNQEKLVLKYPKQKDLDKVISGFRAITVQERL